jgi:non-ribosomal peptide synthetase component F
MTPPKRSFRLSQKRRDLLDNLLAPAVERIPRQGERGSFPLSFAQQRLWFLDQLEPGNTVYNLPFAVMLEGELDVPALRASLAEVVRRHESLRTRFLGFEGSPLQVVEPPLAPEALPLPVLDLTALPEAARRDEAGRLVRAEVAQPFDLAAGPVFRFRLARLAADRHLAVFSLHHIAADGWSIGVLIQELAALYPAFLEGRPSPLPELEIQYADFAVWQRGWLTGERLESQLAFWKERLAGAPERLRLATDRPRPEAPDYHGGTRSLALSPDLSQALRGLAQSEEGTPFMVLLAAYALLLSRHSGQEDVVVGSPIANRNRAQLEPLIGFFVNTLALRVDLSADPPFRTLLREVRDLTLGAYAHQDLPLERLVDELGVRRELDHTPLFQVLLTLQNAPVQALRLPGLSLAPAPAEGGATRFDLTLSMGEGPGGALGGTLYYRADLFDAPTADRLLAHFQVLLAGIAAGPDRRLSDLPLLAEPERLQLLAEWNDTRAGDPRQLGLHQLGLHQLIGARAAEAPDAVAVEMGAERLTYADLDRRANRLARHLAGLGVGPESRVGVLLERSPDLVAVLLAVLKAGAAYLPLDPAHPAERLAWLLADAEVSLTVTREGLDRDATAIAGRSDAPFDAGVGPDALAYVLYTSGSTGRPKGVMVPHRGVVGYLTWAAGAYGMTPGAAVPVHSPLGFDLTVTSLFAPLIAGGRVVLVPEGPGIEALGEALLREDGFALVKLTPAHLALLRDFPGQWTGRVRRFVVGGEALLWESFAFLGDAGDTVRVVNEYGPTEATVGCCV